MRANLLLISLASCFVFGSLFAQNPANPVPDSLFFNEKYWSAYADQHRFSASEKREFLQFKRDVFLNKIKPGTPETEDVHTGAGSHKGYSQNQVHAGPCTNIDFETGTTTGWTLTSGFHPNSTSIPACCPTNGAQNTIMTGLGVDPYGGFPVVFPGGNFSLRLGNNGTGAQADRIRQTFFVTPANANFTYRYAVVLQDPGHNLTQQPAFVIDMVDSIGNPVPCTAYSVAAGNNIPGFFNSPTPNVVYKPWTSVAMDLTPMIGKNVTLRFTTYDCSLGGHFGYAYVDGLCTNFATDIADTTCPGVNFTMCGPVGFGFYSWNGPGVVNNPNQCISVQAPGVYTCQTILVPGCPGPDFTHTLSLLPNPVLSFTPSTANACSFQYSFASTSSISAGSISSYTWNFGDNTGTILQSPVHVYPGTGTYTAKFKAVTNRGCRDSVLTPVIIYPFPNLAYSPPSNCINTVVQFTNYSSIPVGSIASYSWNLGNGATSNAIHPTNVYTLNGTYNVTLSATSDQGCVSTLNSTLGIFPPPVLTFTASNFCEGDNTVFSSSTSIASGSIVSYNWNFGDGGTSTLTTPTHVYPGPGNYTATFSAVSNHYCVNTLTNTIVIEATPALSFSVNIVCLNGVNSFVNTSTISAGSIASYTWNFGDGSANSNLLNPAHSYTAPNIYTATLNGVSALGCPASVTRTLEVYPLPVIAFSPPSSCLNTVTQFTNTSTIATGSLSTFNWDFGNNITSTLTNPAYTYTANGVYNVSLTVGSSYGCTNTAVNTISIFPRPSVSFSFNSVCHGNNTAFSGSTSITSGSVTTFNWNFGDGGASGLQNSSHTFSAPASYSVTFSATSNNNCASSVTHTVTIHPAPQPNFITNSVCLGAPNNFSDLSTISTGSITQWNWSYGDGNTSNFQNPVHTYTNFSVLPYTVTLTVVSQFSCPATFISTVAVHPIPVIAFSPPSACEGSVTQFTNTSSVAVGTNVAYSWTFGDGGTSNLVNPSHFYTQALNYSVALTATTDQGCTNTGVNTLSILPYPQGSITSINSSCINNTVSINPNISISSGFAPTYTVNFGDGNVSLINGVPINYTVAHTYTAYNTYTVYVTANSNSNCARTFSSTVAVYPKPFVNFVSNHFCFKDSTVFINTSTISPGYLINEHLWFFGNGVATSTLSNTKHRFTAPGIYSVVLTEFSYPEPGLTCSLSAAKQITINALPVPTFYSSSVCVGVPTNFSNTTQSPGLVGLTWNFNGYGSSSQSNPSFVFPSAGTFTTSLAALNSEGCRDTLVSPVVVFSAPSASFTANNACLGDPVNFFNHTSPGSGGPGTYSWTTFGQPFSTTKDPTYTFTNSGTYLIELTSTSNLGCSNKYSNTVTVYPLPVVNFTANETCLGNSTIFNNLSGSPAGIDSWCWDFNNGNVCNDTSMTPHPQTFQSSGSYHVVLTARDKNQCKASKVRNIIVHANPLADFTHKPILCAGDNIVFTNLSSSPDGSLTSYQWDFNEDNIIDAYSKEASFNYKIYGQYRISLEVRSQYGCNSIMSRIIYANPKAVAAFSTDKQEGCPPLCVNFKDLSTISSGSIQNISWDFGDGTALGGVANTSHCYNSGAFDLKLELTTDAGCVTTYTHPAYINVYQNPKSGFQVIPEEVDEEFPEINVVSKASNVTSTKYFVSDGTNFSTENFTHLIKNLDNKVKPMIVQVVKSKDGCVDTLFEVLNIKPLFVIYFPDVFSPNGDGVNDGFTGKGVGILKYTMQIFDRWGHKVFETTDINEQWDGTSKGSTEPIKQDVYVWKAWVTDVFNIPHRFAGHVTLIK